MLPTIEYKYEMDLGQPTAELLEWAKNELGEDQDTRCEVISNLRDLVYKRGECSPHRDDDAFLLRFLRARYFVVPRAHRLLVNYCDFREANPELFLNVGLKGLLKLADYDLINLPTYRDQKGRRMIILKIKQWDPEKVAVNEIFQVIIALLQAGLLEESTQISGVVVIFDMEGITMHQALQMTPGIAKKIVQISATCLPVRVVETHVVNQPWIFKMAFNVVKPFLNDTMKENIFFHGYKVASLHGHIDPERLPRCYGGKQEYQNSTAWIEYFRRNEIVKAELKSLSYDVDGF